VKKIFLLSISALLLLGCLSPGFVLAHQPRIIYSQTGNIQVTAPEVSQAFYDELKGAPRDYFIESSKDFDLYLNLLVPSVANITGRYSADVFNEQGDKIYSLDGDSVEWKPYFEEFGRDWYLSGPELDKNVPAGKYKVEVYSKEVPPQKANQGKYVLAVGKVESFDAISILNVYWQIPLLKVQFFKTSVLQFFITPFGIWGASALGILLLVITLINYFIGLVHSFIKHNMAKTLLLTSGGMKMKEEIVKLLQKPAYDITVAFISTAAKPQEDLDYLKRDWTIMKDELGFNVEEVDIEGKTEAELLKLLGIKDIIFVEGGNTFYLLKAMRDCNFEKVIKKLLKEGKVYIGASAGSIVAGRTIRTAEWLGDENIVRMKNFKGLNLVPFDIFVHYLPENAEIIKSKIPNLKKRYKNLKILTDDQALLIQGKETSLIGNGEAIIL
jgi:dipeptidase E